MKINRNTVMLVCNICDDALIVRINASGDIPDCPVCGTRYTCFRGNEILTELTSPSDPPRPAVEVADEQRERQRAEAERIADKWRAATTDANWRRDTATAFAKSAASFERRLTIKEITDDAVGLTETTPLD